MSEFILNFFYFLLPIMANVIGLNNIFKKKFTIIDNLQIILATIIGAYISNNMFPATKNLLICLIPMIIVSIKIRNVFIAIVIQFVIYVVIGLSDSFLYSVVYVFLGENYTIHSVLYWIISIVLTTIIFIITKFIGDFINKHKVVLTENLKSRYLLMAYIMIFIAASMFYFFINWSEYVSFETAIKIQSVIASLYGIISMGVCICLLHMGRKEEKYKHEQIELRNLREYTENLEELYTEMRKFRHDYINIISSISAFVQERDCEGLEEYFCNNIQPLNKTIDRNNYKLGLLKNIHLQEIKGLISAKVIRAQELGIDVVIDIVEVIDNIDMDRIDLVRSLGILLDNAIDAAVESVDKKMNVALIKKDQSVIIVVSNTYGDNILPIGKMYKEGVSTKGENRGLGLSNLKEMLSKYKNITLDTYIEGEVFTQEVYIHTR